MKIKTILLGAALAATIPMKAAQSYFVIFDSLLRVPALCYPLPPGWTGMGWVKWNVPARSNPYLQSTILLNPSERRIVQEAGIIGRGAFLLSQSGGIYSDPNAMAQHLAQQINSGIVVPGLSNFRAKGGRFSDNIPPKTQQAVAFRFASDRVSTVKKAFKVECFFDCDYNGARCEALYEFVCAFNVVQVRRNLPATASAIDFDTFLTVAPPGELAATKKVGGRLLAGGFENRLWRYAANRMMTAILQGQMIGMNEGMDLMRQARVENEKTMDKVRRNWSEMIREVKTVDNPLSPGDKIERPIYFNHSLINSRQDTLIMSDRTIEPHEAEKLMGQGFWTAVD
jgi:hypothetical protein